MKNVLSTATSGDEMAVIQGAFGLSTYTLPHTHAVVLSYQYTMCARIVVKAQLTVVESW